MICRVGRCDHERLSPTFLRETWSSGIGNPYLDRSQPSRAQGIATLLNGFYH